MNKFKFNAKLIAPVLILALLLSGCGSSYKSAQAPGSEEGSQSAKYEMAYDQQASLNYAGGEAPAPEAAPTSARGNSALPQNTKIIKSANIELRTKDYDKFTEELRKLVSSLGGYFEYEETSNYGRGRNGNFTVRVKSEKFDEFCNGTGNLAEVKTLSKNSEDVGDQYFDLESRLKTQKTKLERLQELLKKADKMEDIIALENAISETELYIESMSGNLQRYDSLIDYSRINLSVSEIYLSSNDPAPELSFSERLVNAFSEGFRDFAYGLENFAVYMAYSWLNWLLFIAFLVVIFFIVRAIIRKIKKAWATKRGKNFEESAKLEIKKDDKTPEDKNE